MKIIHTADWHLGKNLEGHSRLPEQKKFLQDFTDICRKEKADLILIAGDIYDNYNPPAMAEQLFYDTLKQLSRHGACMIVIISGNHDNPDRLTASGPLAKEHGIVMAGTPNTVIPVGAYGQNEITQSGPGYIHATIHGEKVNLLLVPFPSEKRLGELYLEHTGKDEENADAYTRRMRHLFSDLSRHFEEDAIRLVMSHLFVLNTDGDGSERSVQLGGSYLLPGDIFPEEADYIALGHIHKPQKVPGKNNARYSGSPLHYNQREVSFCNQVLSITLTANGPCQIKEISIPVYKPIELWKCDSIEEAIARCEREKEKDSWVYLEIKSNHYIHEEEIKTMKRLKADILSIRPVLSQENPGAHSGQMEDLPFEVLVRNYYRKKFQTEMDEETFSLLMEILNDEGDSL